MLPPGRLSGPLQRARRDRQDDPGHARRRRSSDRPVVLIHGDDEFGSSDLVGGQLGFRSTRVVDNFIHSVVKTEENVSKTWVDHRLTNACKYGFTVIYDEFNRSRPEANNVLLERARGAAPRVAGRPDQRRVPRRSIPTSP